ncbi:MAG: hypothetical protein EXX96DRAFT_559703 [Benjaminiella poitrasii]|nr:MAG: hypothetical protein EXX96DRAFT_559703 [Benjaminiella poitrasii]
MAEISFEHFDPEYELGNLDKNGKPIKPRKKPGRKPNPPTPAQRKAQNRAAQRAFRERKRREMLNAETNIKRCLLMRDQALREVDRLKRKLKEVKYENNFLRGQVLTLKVACMANRVDVPKFWDTGKRDRMGSDITTSSRHPNIPQSLEFFLNRQGKIVTMEEEQATTTTSAASPNEVGGTPQSTANDDKLDMILSLLPMLQNELLDPTNTDKQAGNTLDLSSIISSFLHQSDSLPPSLDPSLVQYLFEQQPDVITDIIQTMKDVPPELWLSIVPPELASFIPPEIYSLLNNFTTTTTTTTIPNDRTSDTASILNTGSSLLSPPLSSAEEPIISVEQDFWSETNIATQEKIYVAGPIAPLDAVKQMRTMRDQNDNRYLLTPTELQQHVPHDPRIDLIPGPTMRDYMIIFQDYYDANELFGFLLESAVFIGGELGNPDCWFVPPSFMAKYWFLCPNYKPTRPDNSVELAVFFAQRLVDSLKKRKAMYIMRDHYPDYFLPLSQQESPKTDESTSEDNNGEDEEEEAPKNDIVTLLLSEEDVNTRIDILAINTLNKEEIPRITSPNVFTL